VVIVIIGILVILALTQYGSYKETALDKEARANLKLMMAAERIYRMTAGGYYPMAGGTVTVMSDINKYLKLFLSTVSNRRWNYLTTSDNVTSATCVQATRNGADARTFRMRQTTNPATTDNDPVAGGSCP